MAHTEIEKAEHLVLLFASCFNQSHSPLVDAGFHAVPSSDEPCTTLLCDENYVYDLLVSLDTSKSTGPDGIS